VEGRYRRFPFISPVAMAVPGRHATRPVLPRRLPDNHGHRNPEQELSHVFTSPRLYRTAEPIFTNLGPFRNNCHRRTDATLRLTYAATSCSFNRPVSGCFEVDGWWSVGMFAVGRLTIGVSSGWRLWCSSSAILRLSRSISLKAIRCTSQEFDDPRLVDVHARHYHRERGRADGGCGSVARRVDPRRFRRAGGPSALATALK